ncbi:MAG: efflux RND transporter periplasmic adaptor subunit [Pyrinomonadaceae bacterium]
MSFSDIVGWLRAVSLFCLITVFAVVGSACGGSAESKTKTDSQEAEKEKAATTIAVSTAKAVAREVPSYVQATGSLAAQETSDVAPKTSGQVISTPINVGAFVRQGDVIAKLDDKNARLQVQQLQANVRQTQAGVLQAQARLGLAENGSFQASTIPEVRVANANYEQSLAELKQAQANEQRYRDLVQTGDTSMQNYESYRTLRDTAQARVNAAKQALQAAVNAAKQNNEAVKSAEAAVEAARTQVATAQQVIADAIVRAPYSGYISSRPVAVGENVSSTSVIATLLRTNPLKLQLQIGEKDVPLIKVGMGVSLEVDAYKDRKFAGTVSAINPLVDPQTRTAIVEAEVENNGNLLRSGMFATARIARPGGGQGVFVPKSAVYSDQNTQSYRSFVIRDGVAKLRVVQIGQEETDEIQILSGLNPNETVATSNLEQLYEGAKVKE